MNSTTNFLGRIPWLARALGLLLLAGCIALHGCAAVQQPMHTLHYCNVGTTSVSSIRLYYGRTIWPLPQFPSGIYRGGNDINCLGGSGIGASMPIPEIMSVEWVSADGLQHKIDVPVKSKLDRLYPPNTIQVRFNNDQLEVIERFYPTPAERIDLKIYP